MDVEIQVAIQFIVSFINEKVENERLECFCKELRCLLCKKFEGHWYPEKPAKGSAFRCVSIENHLDNLLVQAAKNSQIPIEVLCQNLPKKLDLWIDPSEVSYRIGEHGLVIVIYKEGDDCVNSTSEYLAKVLNQLPTVTETDKSSGINTSDGEHAIPKNHHNSSYISQHLVNNINMSMNQRRNLNHLSASAKSFVSRKNGVNIPFNMNPLFNLEYLQKLQNWPLLVAANGGGYDPLAAQLLQNYLVVQELQRFETQRLALQNHLIKMHNLNRWSKKHHSNNNRQNGQSNSSGSSKTLQQVSV